ncbi:MAG: FAD-dependent oxidoreductase [Ferroplasma sp.]|uniref:NAD(P)/FAD-dependent oxidoreductase n=1 Tax=Ferroplasma sp. TaxID=2591003 RepID=UPI0028157882|nr:FAD-dependent oxidoreductase [Ferroplasma sp.]WMT51920.1 MAG: FAD-dependent oxidoreductase [Ferroplasma sp.]
MAGRIVILGGGIAGVSAKLRNRHSVLIDENPYLTMAPRIMDIISGRSPDYPLIPRKLDHTGRVQSIDFENRRVHLHNKDITYDRLIIALGHSQNYSFIKGSKYIHGFSGYGDAMSLRNEIMHKKHIIIIGGGYLGVELAGAIGGNRVTVMEGGKQILAGLPSRFAKTASDLLSSSGVNIALESPVEEVKRDAVIASGKRYESDLTLFAGGFTGNIPETAQDITTKNSRIAVNSYLQSLDYPDVYAAGDTMFVENGGFIPMSAIIARSAGITAMENAMGFRKKFKPNNFANIIRVGKHYFGTVGNTFVQGIPARLIKEAAVALTINHAKEI